MLSRRFHLHGLFAVLLALMAQLGAGAAVPRLDPIALVTGAAQHCHATSDAGGTPDRAPEHHPATCLICPLCAALHAPSAALVSVPSELTPPGVTVVVRSELPPPPTAPPAPHRPPSQPRAPPIAS